LLVFIVSIIIPVIKLLTLAYLLIQTHRHSAAALTLRTRLYRFIDFIGRWSMLDVFVVSILAGLVRFGQGNEITAAPGIAFFAGVVVLTLFAVESFDPRLMWDAAHD
jgi:paraquat-inducible protein A